MEIIGKKSYNIPKDWLDHVIKYEKIRRCDCGLLKSGKFIGCPHRKDNEDYMELNHLTNTK